MRVVRFPYGRWPRVDNRCHFDAFSSHATTLINYVPLPWNQAEREYVYLFEEIRVIYPIDSSKFIDVAASWMDGWMQGLFLDLWGEKYRDSSYLEDYLFIFFYSAFIIAYFHSQFLHTACKKKGFSHLFDVIFHRL